MQFTKTNSLEKVTRYSYKKYLYFLQHYTKHTHLQEQQVAKTPQKPIALPPWVLHWFLDKQTPPVFLSEPKHCSPLPTVKILPGACLGPGKKKTNRYFQVWIHFCRCLKKVLSI